MTLYEREVTRGAEARAAYAFTAGSLAFGVFNYLFQVHAAAVLSRPAFGALSAWLAQVTMVSSVGAVLQLLSLESPVRASKALPFLRGAALASAAIIAIHLTLLRDAPSWWLGVVVVCGACLFAIVSGQLQARLWLGVAAAALLAAGLSRFAYPFAWPIAHRERSFYVSHALAGFVGVVIAGVLARSNANDENDKSPQISAKSSNEKLLQMRRPLLLAFAGMAFPTIDVLAVSWTNDEATTGAYSRVGLVARAIFFLGAAIVQTILPYQVRRASAGTKLPDFAARIERSFVPAAVIVAIVVALAADVVIFREANVTERTWLFGSSLSAAMLVAILARLQELTTSNRFALAAWSAVGVCVVCALSATLTHDATRYVEASLAGYALVLAADLYVSRRNSPGAQA